MRKIRKPEQQIIQPNEGGFYLHENYILYFGHFDGFTPDLLSIDLFIDTAFNFDLSIGSMEKLVNYNSDRFEGYAEGQLPNSIQHSLKNLLTKNIADLKNDYTDFHPGMSGQGSQRYLINNKSEIYSVLMELNVESHIDSLKFKSEKLFFKFNNELNNWLEFMHASMKEHTVYTKR